MSTWQIFTNDENNFQWEISNRCFEIRPDDALNATQYNSPDSSSRLPSMADLLLQGCSKLQQNHSETVGGSPMFRTGLGKSVAVKQASMAKALSVLGEDASDDAGCSMLQENCNEIVGYSPMFRTGLGKSVALKQSSIAKALSVLGEDAPSNGGQEQAGDNGFGLPNSLFKTGSGKMVNISSNGLIKAKSLLELEEDDDDSNFQSLRQSRKLHNNDEPYRWHHLSHKQINEGVNSHGIHPIHSLMPNTCLMDGRLKNDANQSVDQQELHNLTLRQPPIKFHTAGGRSVSVSNDALQRARSLLGDPELGGFFDEGDGVGSALSFPKEGRSNNASSDEGTDHHTPFSNQNTEKGKHMLKIFTSPLRSAANQLQFSAKSVTISSGSNLIKKFDAVEHENDYGLKSSMPNQQKPYRNHMPETIIDNSLDNGTNSRTSLLGRSPGRTLVDISNTMNMNNTNNGQLAAEKRRLGKGTSISPFKRPRTYKSSTPLNQDIAVLPTGFSTPSSQNPFSKRKVSTRYPFQLPRMYMREFFAMPLAEEKMLKHFPDQVRQIKSANAQKYMFSDGPGSNGMGPEAFFHALVQCGASTRFASKEWVTNHYKWIVWKLACYERCYPASSAGKILTVSNMLEELKYRYEREVNHGHHSAIKRILEGDASPSSMMILCISSIHTDCDTNTGTSPEVLNGTEPTDAIKVELTDGWYSLFAILDVPLSKQLAAGRLFVGQKLRIWGAGLCGWVEPVSPFEVSKTVSLKLHINGTYRAHWAERLGFCKCVGPPLAFRCIKSNGGVVPRTLARITRIYPILYKERLSNGGSVVRSERMETKIMQLYNHRCSIIAEGIIAEFQRERGSLIYNDSDSEEGAKIFKMLETAAEPEILMADMSPEQLSSFSAYQAKLEATRLSDVERSVVKALNDAGLKDRDVTPFMRVRVVGLSSKSCQEQDKHKEGLITVWNPTEKQRHELVEGQAYAITGLIPSSCDSDILYLQTKGSSTKWQPLSPKESEQFKPFFSHRKSVSLACLGDIPLSSEFDIAAYVVHVGEVYTTSHQKKQWVFVTDESISGLHSEELYNSLLAISFCSPATDDYSFAPINYNLPGSTVGFCNLIKRPKDHMNHIWVAEATERSTYFLNFDSPHCSHLRNTANSTKRWACISGSTIDKIREKVLFIIGDNKG
ncbi:Protein BREAST CANCER SUSCEPTIBILITY 2 B like [Quillaja saponaria]|uniref:Protein BREAST CANCER SUSCEPTIBILITY 2 B like n=1 Tax=Quillaja saponaria TaxID=32244 RepID=A0AAD7PN01_QUISA|nr:Protein BREAST CANCER SUSCEPTIBILITY 2 B like [Quillaja saponaria]